MLRPLLASLVLASVSVAQSAPSDASVHDLDGLVVPDGLAVSLWAESPQLYNPTAMDVDARGRVWVTEAVNYRKWDGRNPGLEHPQGDRVLILEDTDGDGRCDSSKVFVQEEALVSPLGICVVGNQVYVSCSPDILRYTDDDGDDVPDRREVFLTGFGGRDHDHGVHSLVRGHDGYLYGAAGNAGPHVVTDASGWTLRSGSIYRGGGPTVADNKPGLVSDDGRVWTGGIVFRVRPDGTGLEVVAHNFRNQYEVAVDSFGNLFTADNDDDGNAGCRTLWIMEGGNYGYFSADGTRAWQSDRRPGQSTIDAHWHRDDPGVAANGTYNGGGGPTGVTVYEAGLLSRWIDGAVLNCDAGAGVVYAHRPRVAGAGIELEPGTLIERSPDAASDDRSTRWFRPSDVCVAHDGSVLVADWYDPGVGGHQAGDREAYGRILRIAPVEPTSDQGVAAVGVNPRQLGRTIQTLDPKAVERFTGATFAPALRAAAIRRMSPDSPLLADLVRDNTPMVRRAAALLLARGANTKDKDRLNFVLAFEPTDRVEVEALGLLFRGSEERLWEDILDREGFSHETWTDRITTVAWRLHPPSALEGLVRLAMDPEQSTELRRGMIDAIAFVSTADAASAMRDVALLGPEDLRAYAASWSRHRATNDWRAYELDPALRERAFDDAKRVFATDTVAKGAREIDVDIANATTLWLIVTDAGNGNSCDWADWLEPHLVVNGETRDLTTLPWFEAEAQWGEVRVGRNAGGGPLAVDGVEATGIGTHANSRIGFALPEGTERFRARAAVDDGGTRQGGGTSVTFEVWTESTKDREAYDRNAALVRDVATRTPERIAAALELALDPEGGMLLVHLASTGVLDDATKAVIGGALQQNPDLAVRALAREYVPTATPPESEELTVDSLVALAESNGDANRGRALFFDQRARCGTCHAMVRGDYRRGGDIGPELTLVRDKLGRREIAQSILEPSAAIAHGYDTWLIEDVHGRLYSGFLLADGETVVLKDTSGKRVVLDAEDVAGRWRQEISAMPEGLALGLTPDEVADVLAFLLHDPDRAPELGEPVALFDGESLDGWTHYLQKEGARAEDVWSIENGELLCEGRPIGYLRTVEEYENFQLTLEWRFDPERGPGNSGVLLRVQEPDEVWPKSIEAQLQHRNAGDIWNIDRFDMDVDGARTNGRHTARLLPSNEKPLGEWNRYVITLDGEHLTLEVNGEVQNEARWCEPTAGTIALQSEGAAIRFRNIVLRPIVN